MRTRDWLSGLAAALALVCARPADADWPNVLAAQPLVQAPRVCPPMGITLNRRCRVIDFAPIGQGVDGHQWFYSFISLRWADRHGRKDRGYPVIFYQNGPATLRLSLWLNDEPGLDGRLAQTAQPRPMLLTQNGANYLGFTLKVAGEPDEQRLFRQNKSYWKDIPHLYHRTAEDQAKLVAAMPHGCEAADDGFYDWTDFWLVLALRETLTHAPCGYLTAPLAVSAKALTITAASYHKAETRPAGSEVKAPAALTPSAGGPTSQPR